MLLCLNWSVVKTESSVVVNRWRRCFGSAFSECCLTAEQELTRRNQSLGGYHR